MPVKSEPITGSAITVRPYFAKGADPFEEIEWERRTATITGAKGEPVFKMEDVEIPKAWSQRATDIVANKYFRKAGVPLTTGGHGAETSVRMLIHRIAHAIALAGQNQGYYDDATRKTFYQEMCYLLVNQMGAFNSPVWFNVGLAESYGIKGNPAGNWVYETAPIGAPTVREDNVVLSKDGYVRPQGSACFIRTVEDDIMSIAHGVVTEMRLFKWGSGTGTNFSKLRARGEPLSGGGKSSGLMSFLKIYDAAAGSIKSGGVTRRASKMVILDAGHPDIEEFIDWKVREEEKATVLRQAGYSGGMDGEAYGTVSGQNANNSVRATDEFMRAVEAKGEWAMHFRVSGKEAKRVKAHELMRRLAKATWTCGDPGMQFHDTCNRWNTTPADGEILASNPCSEFMAVDNTACNLASLNLHHFVCADGALDVASFQQAVRVFILAQEILVDYSSYPTAEIARNSHQLRPLGLGYANLGALLMRLGMAYDSDEGRALCGSITALMAGTAWLASAEIAKSIGRSWPSYAHNRDAMLRVGRMHREAVDALPESPIRAAATIAWDSALALGERHGFRNSQLTLLAPTGTISFLMDCDTTGIEPAFAIITSKKLAGGGHLKIVNRVVPVALERLGYTEPALSKIMAHVEETGTVKGAPYVKPADYPVFATAVGDLVLAPRAHLRMVAAAQPFLCGAVSKTVNVPEDTTVEQMESLFIEGWKLGLKAVALYRNNSKGVQVLTAGKDGKGPAVPKRERKRLAKKRLGFTQEARVGGHKVYLRTGEYENGELGEIFIDMQKQGATVGALLNVVAICTSLGLQHGVPLEEYVDAFTWFRFQPSGPVSGHEHVRMATSVIDYIFKVLAVEYLGRHDLAHVHPLKVDGTTAITQKAKPSREAQICPKCGGLTETAGTCAVCTSCGETTGCS